MHRYKLDKNGNLGPYEEAELRHKLHKTDLYIEALIVNRLKIISMLNQRPVSVMCHEWPLSTAESLR